MHYSGNREERPLLQELERVYRALDEDGRQVLLEELLVACSLGWPQAVRVLESYVLDYEVRETIDGLPGI